MDEQTDGLTQSFNILSKECSNLLFHYISGRRFVLCKKGCYPLIRDTSILFGMVIKQVEIVCLMEKIIALLL